MSQKEFSVHTIFLANFYDPAKELAVHRRKPGDAQGMVNAMKRAEIADQTLAKELNNFAERGYDLVSAIQHPLLDDYPGDLIVTAIFSRDKEE